MHAVVVLWCSVAITSPGPGDVGLDGLDLDQQVLDVLDAEQLDSQVKRAEIDVAVRPLQVVPDPDAQEVALVEVAPWVVSIAEAVVVEVVVGLPAAVLLGVEEVDEFPWALAFISA